MRNLNSPLSRGCGWKRRKRFDPPPAAESAARKGDQRRAALLIGWGRLTGVANLRPTLGKSPAEVSADHEYFKRIAERAKALLHLTASDPVLRDRRVFDGESS